MHAVVVKVTMNDINAVKAALPERVVPLVSGAPGFLAGYWTTKDNTGLAMFIFETEEVALQTREIVAASRDELPDMVTLDDVEVREVVAHAGPSSEAQPPAQAAAVDDLPATAPQFTLQHVLGHEVSMSDYAGRRVVVTFGGRESAAQIEQGIGAIRGSYDEDQLAIVGISDVRSVPRAARIIVKNQIKKAYEGAVKAQTADLQAAGKPPRADPSKDVVMLLDWSGSVVDAFGCSGVDRRAVAVAVDEQGRLIGVGSGPQLGPEIIAVLAREAQAQALAG